MVVDDSSMLMEVSSTALESGESTSAVLIATSIFMLKRELTTRSCWSRAVFHKLRNIKVEIR